MPSEAMQDVAVERSRQQLVEGYDASHDDMATRHQLALAAMGYIQASASAQRDIASQLPPPRYWPWDQKYWKPTTPRRNLVKAAALIIAEIERLDRAAASPTDKEGGV